MDNLLTPEDLVRRWRDEHGEPRVTLNTLRNWRSLGKGPTHRLENGRVVYAEADVARFESNYQWRRSPAKARLANLEPRGK